jgi:hypothetical protein
MKNLNLFLWIFTTAIATFFAYHTYTHTQIRYKDLESVMMQNLAMEKGIKNTNRETKKIYNHGIYLIDKMGNNPKDNENLYKAKTIKNHTDSLLQIIDSLTFIAKNTKIDDKLGLDAVNIALLNEYAINYPQFVAKQDTALLDMKGVITTTFKNEIYHLPFLQQNNLHFQYVCNRIGYKSIERMVARVGGVGFHCYFGIPIIKVAKSYIVKSGAMYEASVFITDYDKRWYPKMQISKGIVNVRGEVGSIEIKNVKAQSYNSEGKATKTLTGKITIMKADGSDTTFTLSTSYTVKKK